MSVLREIKHTSTLQLGREIAEREVVAVKLN